MKMSLSFFFLLVEQSPDKTRQKKETAKKKKAYLTGTQLTFLYFLWTTTAVRYCKRNGEEFAREESMKGGQQDEDRTMKAKSQSARYRVFQEKNIHFQKRSFTPLAVLLCSKAGESSTHRRLLKRQKERGEKYGK